jgi:hypothetical protein
MPPYPRSTFSDAIAMERGCSSGHRDNQEPLVPFLTLGNWRKMYQQVARSAYRSGVYLFEPPPSAKVRSGFAPSRSAKPGKAETFRSGGTYE